MIRILLFSFLILFMAGEIRAQNKKELQAEVNRLQSELSQKDEELRTARNNERISVANAAEYEAQVKELQDANATLLESLKKFTQSSQQRSETIGQTLESLKDKEAKLKLFSEEQAKNDSIALLILSDFKQTLGEDTRAGVKEGEVAAELNSTMIFGSSPTETSISAAGKGFLDKIAAVVKKYPDMDVAVLTKVDSLDQSQLPQQRALAIKASLGNAETGTADRVSVAFKQASATAYEVRFRPRYSNFYYLVKETLKNSR